MNIQKPKRKLKIPLYEKYRDRKPSKSIKCGICGKRFKNLATHIVMIHDVTTEEYREEFPEIKYFISEDLRVERSAQSNNFLIKSNRMLTEKEIAYVKENFSIKTNQAIADDLGFSLPRVQNIISKYVTEKKQYEAPWKKEEIEYLIKNHEHKSYSEIARRMGKGYTSVLRKAYQMGFVKRSPALPSRFYPEGAPEPGVNEKRLWSKEETEYLKSHYKTSTVEELADFLGRSVKSIKGRMLKLKLSMKELKDSASWKREEVMFVKKNHKRMTYKEMGKVLGRSPKAVLHRMQGLGLKKMENRQFWTDEESEFLLKNYKSLTYKEMGKKLGRSKMSIDYKMNRLGIRKAKQVQCD